MKENVCWLLAWMGEVEEKRRSIKTGDEEVEVEEKRKNIVFVGG